MIILNKIKYLNFQASVIEAPGVLALRGIINHRSPSMDTELAIRPFEYHGFVTRFDGSQKINIPS